LLFQFSPLTCKLRLKKSYNKNSSIFSIEITKTITTTLSNNINDKLKFYLIYKGAENGAGEQEFN